MRDSFTVTVCKSPWTPGRWKYTVKDQHCRVRGIGEAGSKEAAVAAGKRAGMRLKEGR
jgi:hypothetical protein